MQTISLVLVLIAFFCIGSLFIVSSLRSSRFAEDIEKGSAKFYRDYSSGWRKLLLTWHVVDDESGLSVVVKDVIASWELIRRPHITAIGITMVLLSLIDAFWIIVSKGASIEHPQPQYRLAVLFLLCFGMVLGGVAGYTIGFWRARSAVRRRVTYADLRRRRASDYRSSWLRWPLGLVVFLNIVLVIVLLPSAPHMQAFMYGYVWIIAITMCLVFVLGEFFMAYIARMPRLVVTPNPIVAQHADDLLRALIINEIQGAAIMGVIVVLIVQWSLFSTWLTSSPLFIIIQVIMVVLLLANIAPTGMRNRDKGRLGGKITGWAWQRAILK